MSMDRIEKKIVLNAPRSRVWRALTTPREFGAWFGAKLDGAAFAPAALVKGPISTPGYEHFTLEFVVERVDPESLFSYRWHAYAEPGFDYGDEPMTLVEFRLVELEGGTELTVVESGFERLPAARRELAFRMNEGGWAAQLENIARHVSA
jgi:uncharacterized protein YndB with AHSA1/START domain